MQLNGLTHGNVGKVASVFPREIADDAQLFGGEDAVGDGDAHHEEFSGQTLAALAAGGARAIALGVDAPPLEVIICPFGNDAGAAFPREGAHLVKGFPRVLFALKAFSPLGFCLFFLDCWCHFSLFGGNKKSRGS